MNFMTFDTVIAVVAALLVFATLPGTLYLLGPTGEQYAIRVLGVTGRVRLLHFIKGTRQWSGL